MDVIKILPVIFGTIEILNSDWNSQYQTIASRFHAIYNKRSVPLGKRDNSGLPAAPLIQHKKESVAEDENVKQCSLETTVELEEDHL